MNGSLLSLLSNSRHHRRCSKRVQKNFENKWPVCSSEMTSVCFNREQHNGCVCVCARWLCVVILRSTALKCLALKFGLVSRKEHKTTTYIGVFFPSPLQLLAAVDLNRKKWTMKQSVLLVKNAKCIRVELSRGNQYWCENWFFCPQFLLTIVSLTHDSKKWKVFFSMVMVSKMRSLHCINNSEMMLVFFFCPILPSFCIARNI